MDAEQLAQIKARADQAAALAEAATANWRIEVLAVICNAVPALVADALALVAEVARLHNLDRMRSDADFFLREDAERLVKHYGYEPGQLQAKWRTDPPEKFDYQECMAAVLDALNREGIPAWNGDATGCVVQIVEAQAKRATELEARYESALSALGRGTDGP